MDKSYYLRLLGLTPPSSIEEVRKAYRIKARRYHPDLNHSEGAADRFIAVTEAYEYLTHHFGSSAGIEERRKEVTEKWEKYRQQQARERAAGYASGKYSHFRSSGYYKTSSSGDISRIIYNMAISVLIIIFAIYGYIYRLGKVSEGFEKPTLTGFIGLLMVGLIFLAVSVLYLLA